MLRLWLLAVLALLSACNGSSDDRAQKRQSSTTGSSSETEQTDDGELRAEAAGRALIGTPAPKLIVKTIDGQSIDLAKVYGHKAIYLKFWATWCVPCREQMPHLKSVFEKYGGQIVVIAVNTGFNDSREAIVAYRSKLGLKMPIIIDDGRLAKALNLRVTPQHVVIARDGRITHIGHLADARVDTALAVAVQKPADTSTPPQTKGSAAPENTSSLAALTTIDGKAIVLHPPAGQLTALVFLSPWCESYLEESQPTSSRACRRVREQSEALAKQGKMRWIGIASGLWAQPDEVKAYRDKNQMVMPISLDESGAVFRTFDVTHVPTVIIIDAQGRVIARFGQEIPDLAEALRKVQPQR
jgi:thiol-disulfide isomerase/thioredoxin